MGGYWTLPLGWLNNAILINEFSAPRWSEPYIYDPSVSRLPTGDVSGYLAHSCFPCHERGRAACCCSMLALPMSSNTHSHSTLQPHQRMSLGAKRSICLCLKAVLLR